MLNSKLKKYSLIDTALINLDAFLKNATPALTPSISRPSPGATIADISLTEKQRQQSIAMLRVNHSGEVCAQALYQGQALLAKSTHLRTKLLDAAAEENDHLHWCKDRLNELQGNTSKLNPIWYAGSFAIGLVAGLATDRISLGFLAETEHQVTKHLDKHLQELPVDDLKSRAILEQMRIEEVAHATNAELDGAAPLPRVIKVLMRYTAKVMTITAAKI